MAPNHDWKDIILFSISFMFGSLLISGLEVIKKFIQSKPPGRRLVCIEMSRIHLALPLQVTADIHVYQAASLQGLFGIFSLTHMVRAVCKSVSFWATFSIAWLITFPLGEAYRVLQ